MLIGGFRMGPASPAGCRTALVVMLIILVLLSAFAWLLWYALRVGKVV